MLLLTPMVRQCCQNPIFWKYKTKGLVFVAWGECHGGTTLDIIRQIFANVLVVPCREPCGETVRVTTAQKLN